MSSGSSGRAWRIAVLTDDFDISAVKYEGVSRLFVDDRRFYRDECRVFSRRCSRAVGFGALTPSLKP